MTHTTPCRRLDIDHPGRNEISLNRSNIGEFGRLSIDLGLEQEQQTRKDCNRMNDRHEH